ncbi:MAG: DUF2147 domain-containing protein [Chitinophagaceae bacterium]|nr:DUF2147 domain-containing protein [Chitinophagaceae bacterium]
MKKLIVFAAFLVGSFTGALAQDADAVKGVWMNDDKDAKVEIYKSGNSYFGKIIWGKDMYEPDGKTPKKDSKNTNAEMRNRSMINMVILSDFTFNNGEWTGGELYNPKNGKTYKSKMKLTGENLEIRGYVGSPMFGKTTTWTKVS